MFSIQGNAATSTVGRPAGLQRLRTLRRLRRCRGCAGAAVVAEAVAAAAAGAAAAAAAVCRGPVVASASREHFAAT